MSNLGDGSEDCRRERVEETRKGVRNLGMRGGGGWDLSDGSTVPDSNMRGSIAEVGLESGDLGRCRSH